MAFLQVRDAKIYYEVTGNSSGIQVLLIHGVGVCGKAWRPQVASLGKGFQGLIFDNRGIGQSGPCAGPISIEAMARDARALMEHAGWHSAHVVGHSMGGVIAQQLALDCPNRVRSLSLLCTFDRGRNGARLTPWVLWMSLRTRIGSRRMRQRAFLEMLVPRTELERADSDRLANEFASLIGRDLADQPTVLMKQLKALERHDCSARLGELSQIPALVVSGREDTIALPKYGHALAKLLPRSSYEEIAASHGLTIHKPDVLNRMLYQFLVKAETEWKSARNVT